MYRDMHTMPKKEKNSVTFRNFHVRDAGHLRAFSYAFLCDLKFMSFLCKSFPRIKFCYGAHIRHLSSNGRTGDCSEKFRKTNRLFRESDSYRSFSTWNWMHVTTSAIIKFYVRSNVKRRNQR